MVWNILPSSLQLVDNYMHLEVSVEGTFDAVKCSDIFRCCAQILLLTYFTDKSFQAIDCTGTHNRTHNKQIHARCLTKHEPTLVDKTHQKTYIYGTLYLDEQAVDHF